MKLTIFYLMIIFSWLASTPSFAQVPPDANEIEQYKGLHAAAFRNDIAAIKKIAITTTDMNPRDNAQRTPAHVAAYASAYDALKALVAAGADINAMDRDQYDVITISAVKNDVRMVSLAISLGGNPKLVTSPYLGTALIAAAHLGHVEVVKTLIAAGAPLDHVNNLSWTALIEAVILGNGGPKHIATVRALIEGGADKSIADDDGTTPLQHAKIRKFNQIIKLLE